jgi:hypothetical protein
MRFGFIGAALAAYLALAGFSLLLEFLLHSGERPADWFIHGTLLFWGGVVVATSVILFLLERLGSERSVRFLGRRLPWIILIVIGCSSVWLGWSQSALSATLLWIGALAVLALVFRWRLSQWRGALGGKRPLEEGISVWEILRGRREREK